MTSRIVQSDCLAFMNSEPEKSVDLVFGSPPYEKQRLYLEDGQNLNIARTTEEWVAWMLDVFKASLRICKGLVAFVVEGRTENYCYSGGPVLLWAELIRAGITTRKAPIYHRIGIPGSGGPDWLRNDYEFVLCATSGGRLPWSDNKACGHPPKYGPGGSLSHQTANGRVKGRKIGGMSKRAYTLGKSNKDQTPHASHGGRSGEVQEDGSIVRANGTVYKNVDIANPGNKIAEMYSADDVAKLLAAYESGDVNTYAIGGGKIGSRLAHENEAPFPEKLAEFFVRSFCPPEGVVCDPFSGSGTVASVCQRWERNFVGCDLRPSQVDLTKRRLKENPMPLFEETT